VENPKHLTYIWHYEVSHMYCKTSEKTATHLPIYHVFYATDNSEARKHRAHLPTWRWRTLHEKKTKLCFFF